MNKPLSLERGSPATLTRTFHTDREKRLPPLILLTRRCFKKTTTLRGHQKSGFTPKVRPLFLWSD
jgi:hypothetical protein